MSVDKLVDSTQLDADLTSVADAIRTKGGTSAALAFPAGFVSAVEAIQTGGGSGGGDFQSGTFVLSSSSRTFTVPLDGAITNFLFYIETFPAHPVDGSGWLTVGGLWRSSTSFYTLQRYSGGQVGNAYTSTAAVTDTEITCNVVNYNVPAGVNVYWVGW